jgi:hypothetical protein
MIAGMEQAGIAKPTLTGQEFTEITDYLYFLRFFDKPEMPPQGISLRAEGLHLLSSCLGQRQGRRARAR